MNRFKIIGILFGVIALLRLCGCSNNLSDLTLLDANDEIYSLKVTHTFSNCKGEFVTNLYPICSLSEINELPIFQQEIPDYRSLKMSLDFFSEKLQLSDSVFDDEYQEYANTLIYTGSYEDVLFKLYSSTDCLSMGTSNNTKIPEMLGIDFPVDIEYEFDAQNQTLLINDNDINTITQSCGTLAIALCGDDYIYSNYSVHDILFNDESRQFTITISYRNHPISTTEEVLLDYYDLCDRVDFSFSYTDEEFGFRIDLFTNANLELLGKVAVIKYDDAMSRFDCDDRIFYDHITTKSGEEIFSSSVQSVKNFDAYIVYVKDSKNIIRPIYLKQDYQRVGEFVFGAWIDAIDY